MENVYNTINLRSKPAAQQALLLDPPEYTTAIWSFGDWTITNFFKDLISDLQPLADKGFIFDTSGTAAKLHWTLFQLNTFPVNPIVSNEILEKGKLLKQILQRSPHIALDFKGISKSRNGLFLCGYSKTNINLIRNDIRTSINNIVEPHPQDIYHSTLFRFTKDPSEDDHILMDALVKKYSGIYLVSLIPKVWEFGFGTWLQKTRTVIMSWNAHPRWILHRGLSNGPVNNSSLENNEIVLKDKISKGWEVEIDIWKIDEKIYLGHDKPTTLLNDISLLESSNVWVHCKNIEAAIACQNLEANFFIHDNDIAVLTSKQWIWCYPGTKAERKSVCVLPERTTIKDFLDVGAVCSDYMPIFFD